MLNLNDFSTNLIEKEGIYFSKKDNKISYPEEGNDEFFKIEDESFWFKHRNNCIVEAVDYYCKNNVFFDIGGGNGFVSKGIEKNGIKTVLVEPGLQGCLNAKKRELKHIVCSTLEDASFKNNSIPAIGLFDVVEHIEHDVKFLKMIYKLLKNEGYVFITVPAFNAIWSNEDVDAGHYRRYTIKSLEEKLKAVGFTITYSTYLFSILVVAVYLFRSLPSKFKSAKPSIDYDKYKEEHSNKKGLQDRLLNKIWRYELNSIKNMKKIPFGSSCFIIAKKL